MVEVSRRDDDETLLKVIEYWRTHDREREERAARGLAFVKKHFSTRAYLDRLLAHTERFIRGERGISITHEVDCLYEGSDRDDNVFVDLPSMAAVVNDAKLTKWNETLSRSKTPGAWKQQ